MAIYKFPMENFIGVMNHVGVYKHTTVDSMSNDGVEYTIETNIPIAAEEVAHLNGEYGFVEVN